MNIKLKAEYFDYEGRGIAYDNDRTYFIENLLPGETGECEITKTKGNLSFGICKKLFESSPIRSSYPYTDITNLSHLKFEEQLKFQDDLTKKTFDKFKIDFKNFSKIIKHPKSLNKKLELLINDNFRYVDITKFNEKYFLYVSAYGYLTEVGYETEREKKIKYGYFAYLYYIIKNFKKNQFGSRKFRRFSKSSKSPKPNDGEISIGVVKRRKDSFYSKMIKFMTRGGFLRRDNLYLKISECTLKVVDDSTRPYYFNFDGERGHIPNVEEHIKVIKEAIPFFIYPKNYKELFT